MSQRASQTLVTEYLSGNADLRPQTVEQTKRKTAVDFQRAVFLDPNSNHRRQPSGIPSCPEGHALPRSTIAKAARRGISPYQKDNPDEYRIEREEPENTTIEAFRTARRGGDEP